jgi:hypothetical protein
MLQDLGVQGVQGGLHDATRPVVRGTRNHGAPIRGELKQHKAIQRAFTTCINSAVALSKRLPEGAVEWVIMHTKAAKDGHSQLYYSTSPNLEVCLLPVVPVWCLNDISG